MTKPQPNMPIYIEFISDVIKSCITYDQLENARKWANDVMYLNKITKEYIYKIDKAHKAKMQQIQNGLAAKYN